MSQPLISIVIPVWNPKPGVLDQVLKSIDMQTYKNLEVIVVNDGGVELPVTRYPLRITYINQPHLGAPAARNNGLRNASGEYVIFWDADVIGNKDMIETLVGALEKNPSVSFAYCNFYFGWKKMKGQNFNIERLKDCNYITSTTLIRKKDAIQWDESLKRFQDWDYFLTLAELGKQGIWVDEYLFRAITGGTMSTWLPSFVYKKPWCYLPWFRERVEKYKKAKEVIIRKHSL